MGIDFKNQLVILDGAMGTVLQQRGLPPGGQPELLNLTQPELLDAVYKEYIAAFRASTKAQLDSIVLVDKDGNRTKLAPKKK